MIGKYILNNILKRTVALYIVSILFCHSAYSQETKLFVSATPEKSIQVKWISSETYLPKEFNIYRKENTREWIKINTEPIKRMSSKEAQAKSKTAMNFVSAIDQYLKATPAEQSSGNFAFIVLATYDNEMASALGIFYEDKNVKDGTTYQYKLMQIIKGTEKEIAISENVSSLFEKKNAPKGLSVNQNKARVELKWTEDQTQFATYKIYKRKNIDPSPICITKNPVFIFDKNPGYFQKDSNIVAGVSFFYSVVGLDVFGNESQKSAEVEVAIKPWEKPHAIEMNEPVVDKNNIQLSWKTEGIKNLKGYNIYRATEFNGEKIKLNTELLIASANSFTDKTVRQNTSYFYFLETIGNSGLTDIGEPRFATFRDASAPGAAKGLKLSPMIGGIKLDWSSNPEKDMLGYNVYRALRNADEAFVLLTPKPCVKNSYVDSLSKNLKSTFFYKIAAVDSSYNAGTFSEVLSAEMIDITAPYAPSLLKVKNADNNIVVKWSNEFEKDVNEISIYRKNSTGNTELVGNITNLAIDSFIDLKAVNDKLYTYYITLKDVAKNVSKNSNEISVKCEKKNLLETKLIARATYNKESKSILLSWNKPDNIKVRAYYVSRRTPENSQFLQVSKALQSNDFSDKQLYKGKNYEYKVLMIDDRGKNVESEIVKVTID